MKRPKCFPVLLLFFLQLIHAFRLTKLNGSRTFPKDLVKQLASEIPGGVMLNNEADISYYVDIVLGNQTFTVLVDTGSSDLWVAGTVRESTAAGRTGSIKYAGNSVTGPIKFTTVQFAEHKVSNQAFLEITPSEDNPEGYGILGMGPGPGSFITKELLSDAGQTLLERIYSQDNTLDFFTLLLGRSKGPTDFFGGSVNVGEVIPEYNTVLDKPRLPVTMVDAANSVDQHIQVLLDADGIIGPDGKEIPIVTSVEQTVDKNQATVVLDSGFTLPQLPRETVDQIYGRYIDSRFRDVSGFGGVYVLPCAQEVNLTLKFAGQSYPMHPLDMTMDPTSINLPALQTTAGKNACIGTFQPFTYARGNKTRYDIVLGMSFLRNVYTLFHSGDFFQNSTTADKPYVQLLSITDQSQAHQDFVAVRLDGIDTTANTGLKTTARTSGSSKTIYYIVAGVVAGVIVSAVTIFFGFRSRKRR